MTILGVPVNGTTFQTEVAVTAVDVSASAVSISGQVITVTSTSHGFTVGQYVTFSGVTGATGLNNQTWQVATASTNSFTINIATGSSVSGTPGGTILVQRVFNLGPATFFVTTGANTLVEYSPNNAIPNVPGQTWRTAIAASSQGMVYLDGVGSIRLRVNGASGTSRYSQVS